MEERRPLRADEEAILDWFFDQWPELAPLADAIPADLVANVFTADDGYQTLELAFIETPESPPSESPFPGEAIALIDGRHFNAMLFTSTTDLMLVLIWSSESPGRLPAPAELQVSQATDLG